MTEIASTMRALRFHQYGGPEVLQFDVIPIPQPGPGEIQVKVAGSGVNPYDWKLRQGYFSQNQPLPAPIVVATEFSGKVSALGDGVTDFQIGDEVYGYSANGTCAEYLVAGAETVALKPPSMDLADAAAIPVGALTAWQALFDVADLQPGQRVLIHSAAGGVGSFAVQLAKWKGAYVFGTASKDNHHFLQELGVDVAIDYRETPFETVAKDIDVVLETIGGDQIARSQSVLKPGGIVVSIVGGGDNAAFEAEGKRLAHHYMKANRATLDEISGLIQDLKVRPVIDTVVRFDEAIEAQKEVQAGHTRGKIVVRVA